MSIIHVRGWESIVPITTYNRIVYIIMIEFWMHIYVHSNEICPLIEMQY